MHLIRRKWSFLLALGLTAIGVLATRSAPATAASFTVAAAPQSPWEQQELRRLHAHFDGALLQLESADVSQLTSSQFARRNNLVETLRRYDARGVFPHNYDFPEKAMPSFVDTKTGTLCAVGFLLESTGRQDIVNRVAGANNNVFAVELSGDTAFTAWLVDHGLTVAEAARIQPSYEFEGKSETDREIAHAIALPAAIGAALAVSSWNAWGNSDGHSRLGNVLGFATGLAAVGVGTTGAMRSEWSPTVRVFAGGGAVVGAAALALATRSTYNRSRRVESQSAANYSGRGDVETSITPLLPIGKNSGAGLLMSIRF